jgi:hypothetical protein
MDEPEENPDPPDVLREIAAALPMEPAAEEAPPLDPLPPPEPLSPEAAAPVPEPPAEPAIAPRPVSSRALRRPATWWEAHRHELAGLVTGFVALVWMSLGVATKDWGPCLVGVGFALGALLIGTRAAWAGE